MPPKKRGRKPKKKKDGEVKPPPKNAVENQKEVK